MTEEMSWGMDPNKKQLFRWMIAGEVVIGVLLLTAEMNVAATFAWLVVLSSATYLWLRRDDAVLSPEEAESTGMSVESYKRHLDRHNRLVMGVSSFATACMVGVLAAMVYALGLVG